MMVGAVEHDATPGAHVELTTGQGPLVNSASAASCCPCTCDLALLGLANATTFISRSA